MRESAPISSEHRAIAELLPLEAKPSATPMPPFPCGEHRCLEPLPQVTSGLLRHAQPPQRAPSSPLSPLTMADRSVAFSLDGKALGVRGDEARPSYGTWPPGSRSEAPSASGATSSLTRGIQPGRGRCWPSSAQTARFGLWNVATSHPSPIGGPFAGANGGTTSVAFSPDGKMLATVNADDGPSASHDGLVQLWNLTAHHPLQSAALSPALTAGPPR